MPRAKKTATAVAVPVGEVTLNAPVAVAAVAPTPLTPDQKRIAESRTVLNRPLPAGMMAFEAPDGYVMLAEEGKAHAWYRQGNGGKGMWINPMRKGGR